MTATKPTRLTYEDKLLDLAYQDPRVIVLTAENRAPIRRVPELLPGRFIDTGITEQTMIGMAAGLALRGRIPVVHALATFLTMRAFEFIRTDVGIANLPVKMVGFVPGILSEANGPTHQALEDISILRTIPGMRIFCPSDMDDLVIGLKGVLQDPHPWYIRYSPAPAILQHSVSFEIGVAETILPGSDVTIMTYGPLLEHAFEATQILQQGGWSVRLLNMRTLSPVDETAILQAIEQTPVVVTLEDHFLVGGLHSMVAETALKHRKLPRKVLPISMGSEWFSPGLLADVLVKHELTGQQIASTIRQSLRRNRKPEPFLMLK